VRHDLVKEKGGAVMRPGLTAFLTRHSTKRERSPMRGLKEKQLTIHRGIGLLP
jgi:hypothetical protein